MKARHLVPFGLLEPDKPRHFREMLKVVWENRDSLPYAWRILRDGVCDGCSLGPYGLKDNAIRGTHLCTTRLRLLRLNTMGALDPARLDDVTVLRGMREEELRQLGRLPVPMVREGNERGFRPVTWKDALELVGERLHDSPGGRLAFFATSRGLTNETYYVFQKTARLLGSNHVDLCARLCHAASVSGLGETLGVGAPTCSLKDFIRADLVVLLGTDLANNQPVTTKYLLQARRRGAQVVVVNPYREPGLERYWVPSEPLSALFGTPLMDHFFPVQVGGDVAFLTGVLRCLIERGGLDQGYIGERTHGFEDLRAAIVGGTWEELEASAGLDRREMERFADLYRRAERVVFVYSMGLTQHRFGVDNVKAVVNLALARGMLGRPGTGIMPIRGHSGVQGGGECGVDPAKLPGGATIGSEEQARFEQAWGQPIPRQPGLRTVQLVEAAAEGAFDLLYSLGGNLLDTLPDPEFVKEALERVPVRIHQDLVVNSSALLPGQLVVLLPAQTRYEQRGGGTTTNTERRIRFTPEIAHHPQVGEARPEWEIPMLVAKAIRPALAAKLDGVEAQDIRREMSELMPNYRGVDELAAPGDWIQWGGEQLFSDGFARMPGGRARFSVLSLPETRIPPGMFYLSTRRGKQFNSIVYGTHDPLTGGLRDTIFISPSDAQRLGVVDGDELELKSDTGRFRGRARLAPTKPRTLQVFWPEGNVLISRRCDPVSGEPDYNAFVSVSRPSPTTS